MKVSAVVAVFFIFFAAQTRVRATYGNVYVVPDPSRVVVPLTDSSLVLAYFPWVCSDSKRGYKQEQVNLLANGIKEAAQVMKRAQAANLPSRNVTNYVRRSLVATFVRCAREHGIEACVNADAYIRSRINVQYLMYHRPTGKTIWPTDSTVSQVTTTGPCSQYSAYRSTDAQLGRSSGSSGGFDGGSSGSSSTGSSSGSDNSGSPGSPSGGGGNPGGSISGALGSNGGPKIEGNAAPQLQGIDFSKVSGGGGGGKGEGCVAIEHLKGYVLQHKEHLLKPVLCANGFCATPNHAIIVNGVTTSMKQLCGNGTWKCTNEVKWVNNLKIAKNTRAVVGNITVTPYDIRFPVWCIWFVQMMEDLLDVLLSATAVAIASATALFVSAMVAMSKGQEAEAVVAEQKVEVSTSKFSKNCGFSEAFVVANQFKAPRVSAY